MSLLFALCACSHSGDQELRWTEETQLPDGRIITVVRSEVVTQHSSWSGDASLLVRHRATLSEAAPRPSMPTWQDELMAMVIYRDASTQEWVLVATTSDCQVWIARGKPKPPYWEFRADHKEWREVPLARSSLGLHANLINSARLKGREHLTIAQRRESLKESLPNRLYREVWSEPQEFFCGESASSDN